MDKSLFPSSSRVPVANAVNEAGGKAYSLSDEHALAQMASTGCLSRTFYASAEAQLDQVLTLAQKVRPEFVAKCAVYARQQGYMKDMPALLCAVLAGRKENVLLRQVFPRVIDNGKMVRNFVQIIRSGKVGRKSLGSGPRKVVQNWFDTRTVDTIFRASVGDKPSLADVLKLSHPAPISDVHQALFGYLAGRKYDTEKLPKLVKDYLILCAWASTKVKEGEMPEIPDVPFEMLTALDLGEKGWFSIAKNASWTQTRMNLNTFQRHGVLKDKSMVKLIADRLRDETLIQKSKVFPYQLLMAYNATTDVPSEIREALQDAMEIATKNVPAFEGGQVYIGVDISGSMSASATGFRGSATSEVSCVDVAALFASTILRQNRSAQAIAFNTVPRPLSLNPRDTVLTNAKMIAGMLNGGTACSAPLAYLNQTQAKGDLFVLVSDNQSWFDVVRGNGTGTALMNEWDAFRRRNRRAKMVCIDITPSITNQAVDRDDILLVGGFSDNVFKIIAEFAADRLTPEHWVGVIDAIDLASD